MARNIRSEVVQEDSERFTRGEGVETMTRKPCAVIIRIRRHRLRVRLRQTVHLPAPAISTMWAARTAQPPHHHAQIVQASRASEAARSLSAAARNAEAMAASSIRWIATIAQTSIVGMATIDRVLAMGAPMASPATSATTSSANPPCARIQMASRRRRRPLGLPIGILFEGGSLGQH